MVTISTLQQKNSIYSEIFLFFIVYAYYFWTNLCIVTYLYSLLEEFIGLWP
jgi:hypothetical protein